MEFNLFIYVTYHYTKQTNYLFYYNTLSLIVLSEAKHAERH